MKTILIIITILLSALISLKAQENVFSEKKYDHSLSAPLIYSANSSSLLSAENKLPSFTGNASQRTLKPASLPKYAQENPAGHSYLCRLEVKIEKKLPVGLWMKVGESSEIVNSTGNNLHFRLLKRF